MEIADGAEIILIAEDNADEVFLLGHAFKKTGLPYELRFVADGQQVIDYLARSAREPDEQAFGRPVALVLDLKMPSIGGFEVLEWLNARPAFQALPVVVHSGSNLEVDIYKAWELGAKAYFVKTPLAAEAEQMFTAIAQMRVSDT